MKPSIRAEVHARTNACQLCLSTKRVQAGNDINTHPAHAYLEKDAAKIQSAPTQSISTEKAAVVLSQVFSPSDFGDTPRPPKRVRRAFTKTTALCELCGKEHIRWPSSLKLKHKFCSRGCWIRWKRANAKGIIVNCEICGKESVYYPMVRKYKHHFCSSECHAKWQSENLRASNNYFWKGGKTKVMSQIRNSLDYYKWVRCVFERDSYTCQICGYIGKFGFFLHAHHIVPLSENMLLAYDLGNGQTLCKKCHGKLHGKNFITRRSIGTCPSCNNNFIKTYRTKIYCSRKCSSGMKKELVICHNCKKSFTALKSEKRKFCTRRCMGHYMEGKKYGQKTEKGNN